MRFVYGKHDFCEREVASKTTFLLTNGLGGYSSVMADFSVPRSDQGILVAAVKAPNERICMVHRMSEVLRLEGTEKYLSSQKFADGMPREDGIKNLSLFSYEYTPFWRYDVDGVLIERKMVMVWEKNAVAVLYEIENLTEKSCVLEITPWFKFAPKEEAIAEKSKAFLCLRRVSERGLRGDSKECAEIVSDNLRLHLYTDAELRKEKEKWQCLSYDEDAKDGRAESGYAASCCTIKKRVSAGKRECFEIVFSMDAEDICGREALEREEMRLRKVEMQGGFEDGLARELTKASDAFIAHRDSTNGKTILAGYPLFSDWGRDTMIALCGCCLSTKRYEDAKSILRTFLAYEREGLVPNLFPEGAVNPMYNTVDAALLLIDCVWQYVERTKDMEFLAEAYPVLERIISHYKKGTKHSIFMDSDGLISAGEGFDQVTWMDVCVDGILPTPRHGKPVEINAYWYNALCIMDVFERKMGLSQGGYGALAKKVKRSFVEKFYIKEKGYLRDVISGTDADEQIRCNQIWAVSMSFAMLSQSQEKRVVETVYRYLYTPCGLRTLSPKDKEYHGFYGGAQVERDMAYHQGTVWPFPLGAYYRAYLRVHKYSEEAKKMVRGQMEALIPMLREGCAGQLPEIYDGDVPSEGKGCFAQAWSVGEMLRVLEVL